MAISLREVNKLTLYPDFGSFMATVGPVGEDAHFSKLPFKTARYSPYISFITLSSSLQILAFLAFYAPLAGGILFTNTNIKEYTKGEDYASKIGAFMKKVLFTLFTCLFFVTPSSSLQAMAPTDSINDAIAALTGYVQNLDMEKGAKLGLGVAAGVSAAAILSYWISAYAAYFKINDALDYLQLTGRYARDKTLLWKKHYLINNQITESNFDIALQETDSESVDFPLIALFKKLQQYDAMFLHLRNISDKLLIQTQWWNSITFRKTSSFYQKLVTQRARLDAIIKLVRDNLSAVKKHPNWIEQWKMYQTRDIAFEKTERLVKGVKDIIHGGSK